MLCIFCAFLGLRDCFCFCWFPHSHFWESPPHMCSNPQTCLMFSLGPDVSFFISGEYGLSSRMNRKESEIRSLSSMHVPVSGLQWTWVLRSQEWLCHPARLDALLPALLVVPLYRGRGGSGCPWVSLWFFLFFSPFCPLCSLLSFLGPPRGLWIFPYDSQNQGVTSFPGVVWGTASSFAFCKREYKCDPQIVGVSTTPVSELGCCVPRVDTLRP